MNSFICRIVSYHLLLIRATQWSKSFNGNITIPNVKRVYPLMRTKNFISTQAKIRCKRLCRIRLEAIRTTVLKFYA